METASFWAWLGEIIARWVGLSPNSGPLSGGAISPAGHGIGIGLAAFVLLNLIMGVVTYMIWWLRKVVGWMQSRVGPKHVGWHGLLQTPADALKLLSKEGITPALADRWVFTIAPVIVFIAAYLVYVTIPFAPGIQPVDLNVGVVYVAAVSSITVIGIILGAWASNNKYALVAAFRSAAQIVSYEVPFALALMGPVALAGSFSFLEIVRAQEGGLLSWFALSQPIVLLCFFIAGLAENNVTPFDIVEAESEIVAGFHIEYSGMKFALFFLAEFANTLTLAILTTLVFLGGWHSPFPEPTFLAGWIPWLWSFLHHPVVTTAWHLGWFSLKVFALITVVFSMRAALPRVRVDQLMDLGWKVLIPITLFSLLLTGAAVSLGLPTWLLAAVNWLLLLLVCLLGSRKPLPEATLSPAPPVAASEGSA